MTGRVVVTGIGMVTPVGNDTASAWQALCEGRSGVGPITHFDATGYETRIAAELKGFDVSPYMDRKEARRNDRFVHYAMAAAKQALADSGIEITEEHADDFGVIIGSGIGGLNSCQEQFKNALRPWAGSRQPLLHHACSSPTSPPVSSRWRSTRAGRTSPPSPPARRAQAPSVRRAR